MEEVSTLLELFTACTLLLLLAFLLILLLLDLFLKLGQFGLLGDLKNVLVRWNAMCLISSNLDYVKRNCFFEKWWALSVGLFAFLFADIP